MSNSFRRIEGKMLHRLTGASVLAIVTLLGTSAAQARGEMPAADSVDAASVATADALPSDDSQITVTGNRTNDAIKLKKDALATTEVMSAEQIAKQPGGNIADILSHLPGLTGYSDMGLGQAATGEKEFVTIRGIDASYNAYTMNGVEVPTADFSTRALSLKMMAPYGIDHVTVTKTPTADMPGDSIGGVIDFATPTAFDFDGALNKVTLAGTLSGKAVDMGFPAAGGTGQAEFARKFGSDHQFGIYATAYYDNRSSVGTTLQTEGYTPTLESESGITDWRNVKGGFSSEGLQSDFYREHIKRYGGNVSLDYHGDHQTLYLRGTYGHYADSATDSQHGLLSIATSYDENGSFVPVGLLSSGYFQLRDQTTSLATIQAGGSTKFDGDRLTISYDASVGQSKWARPNYVEASFYGQYITDGSAAFDASNPAAPVVNYTNAAARSYASDESATALWKYQGSDSGSKNTLYSGKIDADYKVGSNWLDSLKIGTRISVSKRYEYQHQFMGDNGGNFVILDGSGDVVPFTDPQGATVAAISGTAITDAFGLGWKSFDRSTIVNGILPYKYTSQYGIDPDTGQTTGNPGAYTINDYLRNTVYGTESVYAGYGQANMHFGPVQAVAGLRYEYTDFRATNWEVLTTENGTWVKSGRSYGELLPSLNLVWRPDPFVLRASVHRGFSRPAFGLIASPETVTIDDVSGIQYISKGNPNLKATTSWNYDLGVEWYGHEGSVLTVAGYYKTLKNYIFTSSASGVLPGNGDETVGDVTMPENGSSASLYGIELNAGHRFKELPGLLSGFGINANATFQHSRANSGPTYDNRTTWLPRAPRQMYNVSMTYDRGPLDVMLTWQHTGLQLLSLTSNNLDEYLQPTNTLDLNVGLNFGRVTVGIQAQNLLNKAQFWKTMGKGTQYLGTQDGGGNGSYVETGRFFKLTTSVRW